MSEGPIKREREARSTPLVSTSDNVRICMMNPTTKKAYCGRKTHKGLVVDWARVICTDCEAAARADQRR